MDEENVVEFLGIGRKWTQEDEDRIKKESVNFLLKNERLKNRTNLLKILVVAVVFIVIFFIYSFNALSNSAKRDRVNKEKIQKLYDDQDKIVRYVEITLKDKIDDLKVNGDTISVEAVKEIQRQIARMKIFVMDSTIIRLKVK